MTVIQNGYVCRENSYHRNWWLIKYKGNKVKNGIVRIGYILFPLEMVGKRFRLKLEIIEEEKNG